MPIVFTADIERQKRREQQEKEHPERVIDDTNYWEIRRNETVHFQNEPCKHALLAAKKDRSGYDAILPRVVIAVAEDWVGCTICLDCLLDEVEKTK